MLWLAKKIVLICLLLPLTAQAEWLPAKTNRLVNDYSGILSKSQRNTLEQRLVAFNDSTSNQILVVITPTLGGDDENAVAQRIGQSWGVGQEAFNNGLVILIKSKTPEENWGAVAISTGYGLEGALPDIFCKQIIDDQMIEHLADGNYYDAIVEALEVIEPVARGEYSYAQYRKDKRRHTLIGLGIFVGFVALFAGLLFYYAKKHPEQWKGGGNNHGSNGGMFFGGFPIGYGGGHSSGGWGGNFGGGGFGGFGGGGFGGGGASGRF
ncbi:MAG: TPM domain-containing protein [bacterium]